MSTTKVTFDSNRFIDIMRRKAGRIVEDAVRESINLVAEGAKKHAYSAIADAIKVSDVKVTTIADGLNFIASAYVELSDVPYARAVELGSGLHDPTRNATIDIDAREAPALVFWWEKRDTLFVGQHVNHPGVRARPYLSKSLSENKRRILGVLKARVNGK